MKSTRTLSHEISSKLNCITDFERTKLLVMSDRIITKPYTNHRLDLYHYSIRYKSNEKMIYVYNKSQSNVDYCDYDYVDKIDFPEDFTVKITIDNTLQLLIKTIKINFKKVGVLCLNLFI